MGNYGQAFRRAYGAGWIAESVPSMPGGGSPLAKGKADAIVLLKQDIECAFGSFDQTAVQDTGTTGGSTMAGLFKLIDSANAYATGGAYAPGKPTDLHTGCTAAACTGALTSFAMASVKAIAKALRATTKRNRDYTLLCGLDLREAVTGLTDAVTTSVTAGGVAATQSRIFTQAQSDSALGTSVDILRTDWGRWSVVPTDFIGTTATTATRSERTFTETPKRGYVISREMLAQRWGVPLETVKMAADGGSDKEVLRGYVGLCCFNPTGFAALPYS
jgi:hypothetical protein